MRFKGAPAVESHFGAATLAASVLVPPKGRIIMNHQNTNPHGRRQRMLAATAVSLVAMSIALAMLSLAPPASRSARADPPAAKDVSSQIGELHALQAAFHEALSYNGDPATSAQHLILMGQLFADDATLTMVDANVHLQGNAAIVAFFANAAPFHHDFVSLSTAFRTTFDVDGDTANVYFECHFANPATDVIFSHRFLSGTAKRVHGHWLFQDIEGGPAKL
jgi:hypothetical protein